MSRLTQRDEFGNAEIIALRDVMPELYAELSISETNALTNALNKLADYEDKEEHRVLFGDVIPIAVIKRAIAGINAAESCDQAGRYDYELRRALKTVLEWYESPSYKWDLVATKQRGDIPYEETDPETEKRILRNFISSMPKVYRARNQNWVIVQTLITSGTNHAGHTSAIKECLRIGIDPDGFEI